MLCVAVLQFGDLLTNRSATEDYLRDSLRLDPSVITSLFDSTVNINSVSEQYQVFVKMLMLLMMVMMIGIWFLVVVSIRIAVSFSGLSWCICHSVDM